MHRAIRGGLVLGQMSEDIAAYVRLVALNEGSLAVGLGNDATAFAASIVPTLANQAAWERAPFPLLSRSAPVSLGCRLLPVILVGSTRARPRRTPCRPRRSARCPWCSKTARLALVIEVAGLPQVELRAGSHGSMQVPFLDAESPVAGLGRSNRTQELAAIRDDGHASALRDEGAVRMEGDFVGPFVEGCIVRLGERGDVVKAQDRCEHERDEPCTPAKPNRRGCRAVRRFR